MYIGSIAPNLTILKSGCCCGVCIDQDKHWQSVWKPIHSFSKLAPWLVHIWCFMSGPHRLVSTAEVVFTKVHSWRLLPGFPLAPTLPPRGLVGPFQGNFNADRIRVASSRTSQANISSTHCLFGHQFKSIFQYKTINIWDEIVAKCKFPWSLLSLQSSGWLPHLPAGYLVVRSGAGLSSHLDWTQ